MLLIARAIVRRRWLALVALGLVAGLAGATVTSAVALARRTGTAYERLEHASASGDVSMFVTAGDDVARQVVELPGVESAWQAGFGVGAVAGTTEYVGVLAGPPPPEGLFRPIPIEGRLPDPDAADEVVLHELLAREAEAVLDGPVVGARIPLRFLTREDFEAFDTGFGEPHGPAIEVTVVGIVRLAGRPEALFSTFASPAFAEQHPDALFAPALYIDLEGGESAVPAFLDQLDRLARELAPLEEGAEEFVPFEVELTSESRGEVATTSGALVTGLLVFALVAGIAGMIVIGQAFARYHAATATDQQTESALGLSPGQRAGSRALAAALSALLAAVITAGIGAVAGSGDPIGAVAAYEPRPGRSMNIAVVAGGAVGTALVVLAAAGITARFAVRPRRSERRGRAIGRVARLGGGPAGIGVRFATGTGGGDAGRAARIGLTGLVIGIMGVTAALTFGASLRRVVDTPERYGWTGDFAVVDSRPGIDREILADPRVAAATRRSVQHRTRRGEG